MRRLIELGDELYKELGIALGCFETALLTRAWRPSEDLSHAEKRICGAQSGATELMLAECQLRGVRWVSALFLDGMGSAGSLPQESRLRPGGVIYFTA